MARNVLFLLHGIGNHAPGWSGLAQTVLSNEFDRYMVQAGKTTALSADLEIVELSYNDIFINVWRRWSELSTSIGVLDAQPKLLNQAVTLLGESSSSGSQVGNNRNVDYAGDALLYYSSGLVRRLVLLRLMSEMSAVIVDRMQKNIRTEFGVMGHSLGTAVAHDALHILGTANWTRQSWDAHVNNTLAESEVALSSSAGRLRKTDRDLLEGVERVAGFSGFSAEMFQFSGVFMVANTCCTLARECDPYQSIVRPGPKSGTVGPPGNTDWFINISHTLDPVAQIRKFDASRINNPVGFALDINVSHLYSNDVHALDHYLLNPKVHREVFGTLCPDSFGPAERAYAHLRFDEQLEADMNPDYFRLRSGDFSDAAIAQRMRQSTVKHLSDLLERLT